MDEPRRAGRIVIEVERRDLKPAKCATCRERVYLARLSGTTVILEWTGLHEGGPFDLPTAILKPHDCPVVAELLEHAGDRRGRRRRGGSRA